MGRVPSGEDVIQAVERYIGERDRRRDPMARPDPLGPAQLSWQPVLDCTIVRSVETRRQQERTEPGRVDLSDLPTYKSLDSHPVRPPADPSQAQELRLVLWGSASERACDCGNGKVSCPRCGGRGQVGCDPSTVCAVCRGLDTCTECDGTGSRRSRRPNRPRTTASAARATCERCGAPGAACPTCRGRGRTPCEACQGEGNVDCGDCEGGGTVTHDACQGAGHTTSWIEGIIEHATSAETVRLPRQRPPFLVRRRMNQAGQWRESVLTGNQTLPRDLDGAHRAALEPRLVRKAGEVNREVSLRDIPLARIAPDRDPDRVFYAFPGLSGLEVVPVPSRRRVERVAGLALVLVALVVLVLALAT